MPVKRIRKQYVNSDYPLVIMRFEDGHEIKVYKGTGKEFDAYPGETIKLLAESASVASRQESIFAAVIPFSVGLISAHIYNPLCTALRQAKRGSDLTGAGCQSGI